MAAVSLLHFLRDRRQGTALVVVLAKVFVALSLLAFVVLLGAATADSSAVDALMVGPFRWAEIDPGSA